MENRLIDKKKNKQVLIDVSVHQLLKLEAVRQRRSIKSLVEESLAEALAIYIQETV